MQEIKCPKCGEVFQVDEAGYAAIVKQVRDKEFQKELAERQQQFLLDKENSVRLAQAEADNKLQDSLRAKDNTIANLYAKMKALEAKAELDKAGLNAQLASKVFTTPRYAGEAMGYSGILVVHGLNDIFYAYEQSCPYEAKRDIRIEVDSSGLYAICPQCLSKFEIANGGYPVEGPARHYLRTCNVHPNGSELIIEGYSN